MKLRLAALVIGVFGLLGMGAPAAAAAPTDALCPLLYPHCG